MGCATQGEKAAIIKALREEGYQLKHLLKGLNMPKSTYYYEISKVDTVGFRNAELTEEIKKIFDQHKGRYGVRRVYRELLRRGNIVNHKRVQRIMHSLGLQGKRPKEKYHSFKGEVGKVAPNIIDRDFTATAPLQKWTTDVSQFNFSWGKCYLSPIIDMYTNEVISYDLSMSPNLNQIKRMLEMAFKKFKSLTGLIFHSDQGWQYQMKIYQKMLKEKGIKQSMSRKGNCLDNSCAENFFGILKSELFYPKEKEYKNIEELEKDIKEYIEYYNNSRIKSKLKGMSPIQYRKHSLIVA